MYQPGDFDLAGFAVGIAERDEVLPKKALIKDGSVLLGLPSSGIHSNGFALARRVINEDTPELYRELLTPTKIYVNDLFALLDTPGIYGAAHITGGGLAENTKRILPDGLLPSFTFDWQQPPIFSEIKDRGNIEEQEMRRVFNLGIGMVLVVDSTAADSVLRNAADRGISVAEIGKVSHG
jgi:phosphoribosylformylglycinamidine cyclo-ligase